MKNDGGSAFPRTLTTLRSINADSVETQVMGMTLRDYFAAQALIPLITISDEDMRQRGIDSVLLYSKQSAVVAYAFADAMLAERAK